MAGSSWCRRIGLGLVLLPFIIGLLMVGGRLYAIGSRSSRGREVVCPSPKPSGAPIPCPNDYNLVCGKLVDGGFQTFGSGCEACEDTRVVSFGAGPCG